MEGRIHSFESFGTVDGPGVRFVIFMQGCVMRCLYCHNPDTWEIHTGKVYSSDDVVKEVLKYRRYIEKGGVTITGGEPLLQIDFVIELFQKLKQEGLHTCLDTSGITFRNDDPMMMDKFQQLISVCDLFLLDIKHITCSSHQTLTGQSNEHPLQFAKYLSDHQKPMWIRHVLVPGYTTDEADLQALRSFLDTLQTIEKVEVLPYHAMGEMKYENLGMPYALKGLKPPNNAQVTLAEKILGCERYGK